MSGKCRPFCQPQRCCRDFSSRAEQMPSLASIDVVSSILKEAVKKTAMRARMVSSGEMTPDEAAEMDSKLELWLTDTFLGRNPHFATAERWNPEGLGAYLLENCGKEITRALGREPETNEDAVSGIAAIFVESAWRLVLLDGKREAEAFDPESDESLACVMQWAALLTGAPSSV